MKWKNNPPPLDKDFIVVGENGRMMVAYIYHHPNGKYFLQTVLEDDLLWYEVDWIPIPETKNYYTLGQKMNNLPKLSKEDVLHEIRSGIKEAIFEMMEAGNGITGPIIRDVILNEIKNAITEAVTDTFETESLTNAVQNLAESVEGLSTEFYKYRADTNTDPNRIFT